MLLNALEAKPLPIYGDGRNVRDWLYVDDHCAGILLALERGQPGEKYNLGGFGERANLEIVDALCAELERIHPAAENPALVRAGVAAYADLKHSSPTGPDTTGATRSTPRARRRQLGWRPAHDLAAGLAATCSGISTTATGARRCSRAATRRERLGLGAR
jgi:dTDP-glucose 4,6-dehydratase